jgi:hypothetical protein
MSATAPSTDSTDHVPVCDAANRAELRRKYDMLRVGGIPEQRIAVVGRGLRWATRIGTGAAAAAGGAAGAILGVVVTSMLWMGGFTEVGTGATPVAMLAGAASGALIALIARRLAGARGGIAEPTQIEVERYEVLVESARADRAREVLDRYAR